LTNSFSFATIQIERIVQLIQIKERRVHVNRNFSGKQNVYEEIAEQYKEYIRLGLLASGEKLPSVRAAAIELGVNPNTVARAYARLEEDGYVKSLPKKGIYVSFLEPEDEKADVKHKVILRELKQKGISKESLLKWIEEVYCEDD
jgi:GntR family transcriptional regulator